MNGVPIAGSGLAGLADAMAGPLARFAGGLVGPDDPRPGVGMDRLLDTEMLLALAAPFGRRPHPPDRRALVSIWALIYFEAMLPPLLSAIILLDRAPRLEPGDVGFVMGPDRGIVALKVLAEPWPLLSDHRFHGLVADHLTPFIDHVARRGGVTRRVLWSNAGHIFEAFLTMIEGSAAGRPGLGDARRLLAAPSLPWGGRNPLQHPVRHVGGRRIRRVCCLRLLIPEWRVCAICPAQRHLR